MKQPPAGPHAQDLLAGLGPAVVGQRLRRARQRQGLSVRDVAERAGMSKTSVVRLEAGGPVRPSTVVRVCAALGLHVERLAGLSDEGVGPVSVHRASDDRWVDMANAGGGPLLGADRSLSASERGRAASEGVAVPLCLMRSRLPGGRVLPTVLDVHAPSETRSHPGEEFVYVLSGRLRLEVGEHVVELAEGESATFWSAEPHRYLPASAEETPARVLSVRVDG